MKRLFAIVAAASIAALVAADTKSKEADGGKGGSATPATSVTSKTEPAKAAPTTPAGADLILRAMKDELKRSKGLALADVHEPYFIEYTLEDMQGFSVAASLGGLLATSQNRLRLPQVKVRIGDYKFDNSNYLFSDMYSGTRYDSDRFPLDDNYDAFRRVLWLGTDRAYKTAVEAIARKKSALANVTQSEELPDFWKAEPVQKVLPVEHYNFDTERWTDRVKALSKTFGAYPEVLQSQVSFSATLSTHYQENSEGTSLRIPDGVVHLTVRATGHAKDGMQIRDAVVLPARSFATFPSEGDLAKITTDVAEHMRALVNAPAGETYSGPVLFDGIAASQLFAELLSSNLTNPRKPLGEPGRAVPFLGSEFEGRVGSKVLADFLDVVDDPTQTAYNGIPLIGTYIVDEEGVVPKPLTLIEKGKLQTLLLTRQPVKGFTASNGRARLPSSGTNHSAAPSNLFIKAAQASPEADLKKKLIEMVKQRNKPYGMIVRKMDYPSSASINELRSIVQAAQAAGVTRPTSVPLLVYRVYPDGREELIRGMRFRGMTVRALKDITAAGDRSYVFSYMYNAAPFALMDFSSYVAPISVVAPSILFEDLDLERPQEDMPKLPLVPAPPLTASAR